MRKRTIVLAAAVLAAMAVAGTAPGGIASASKGPAQKYLVLYRTGASLADARAAVQRAGGSITIENTRVGLATVVTRNPNFRADATREAALDGVASNRVLGRLPNDARPKGADVERDRTLGASAAASKAASVGGDPYSGLQWDMEMIHATEDGSYAVQPGDKTVIVADIDTGLDGSHPDLAPNFNAALSRNWTTDIPEIDGPCEDEPDMSCNDPADVDENGHGTHTAGTIAAALNGLGIAGVAPNVTIINDRAGQDSGYFFLQETVNALTYAGDIGADVVNMSFYIDPWLYNCKSNPYDSPQEQQDQRTIIKGTQRALDYAHAKGVTLVGSLGNSHTDLGNPETDFTSPDFPPGTEHPRKVTNACLDLPVEGNHVIGVSALGPTKRKAYYSNYGVEQTDVSAPGGDRREYYGTPQWNAVENRVLSTYPKNVAEENGQLNPDGTPNTPFVERNCADGVCAYYTYFQGTSMASPHAAGVAALIVSQYGHNDPFHPGSLTLSPDTVASIMYDTATETPCPRPRLFRYPDPDLPGEYSAFCAGTAAFNGFYGHGIVDALAAVTP